MNTREKKLSTLLFLSIGVLLIAFFALIIWPQFTEMNAKADAATEARDAAQAKLEFAKELKKNEKSINARLANLKARIPSSLEISNVIERIDDAARANNLVWTQGDPEDSSTLATESAAPAAGQSNALAPQLTRHDFSIVVQGTLADFTKFMADLTDKSIGRIIVFNTLDLQFKSDVGPDAIEATLKMQLIGWDKGADIGSDGCTTGSTGAADGAADPNCNRNQVDNPEEGSS